MNSKPPIPNLVENVAKNWRFCSLWKLWRVPPKNPDAQTTLITTGKTRQSYRHQTSPPMMSCRECTPYPSRLIIRIGTVLQWLCAGSLHANYEKTWRHPRNRKYTTYCNAAGEKPSHRYRQHAWENLARFGHVDFEMCKQTDRQTSWHFHRNVSHLQCKWHDRRVKLQCLFGN